QYNSSWSTEAILSSDLDGPFNFLVGGIYADYHLTENSYYVNAFPIDYLAGVLGAFSTYAAGLPPSVLGQPFFRNNTDDLKIKSYGIFGETYFEFNDRIKLTLGLRYNNDKKKVRARSLLASSNGNIFAEHGVAGDLFDTPYGAAFDGDSATPCAASPVGPVGSVPGCEASRVRNVLSTRLIGRAVLAFKLTRHSLICLSYSRGYNSVGINPPLQPVFAVPETFKPEQVDAFEIGSKNTFGNG